MVYADFEDALRGRWLSWPDPLPGGFKGVWHSSLGPASGYCDGAVAGRKLGLLTSTERRAK